MARISDMVVDLAHLVVQLLCAVKQSHDKDVCHGDITCENVLVTSWNWLYLADFASFKPTYIPHDDPSDFSFFFDTGGRRRCYLASERFYDHGGDTQVAPEAPLKKSMDIFSLGCVIAELFLEGQPLFELSQLLAYRRGQYDPSQYLEKIQDAGIRKMILHMIQLDPESRLSCENYLQSYASVIFPSYFSPFLHKFYSCLIPLDSDTRVAVTQSAFSKIHSQMISNSSNEEVVPGSSSGSSFINYEPFKNVEYRKQYISSATDSVNVEGKIVKDTVGREVKLVGDITSLLREVEERKHLTHLRALPDNVPNASAVPSNDANDYKEKEVPLFRKILKSDLNTIVAGYNSQSNTYGMPFFHGAEHKSCEGMLLIASLLCSCMRSVKQPQLRRAALLLLKSASLYIDDEDRLQHVIPYVIAIFLDQAAIVRCAALETLCDVLASVQDFPPSDAKIFPEYILPMLSLIPDDSEESVRICYASNVFKIALTAYRFLLRSQSLIEAEAFDKLALHKKEQYLTLEPTEKKNSKSIDTQLVQLRKSIAGVVHELVMGPKQTPNIRRALLQDIGHLCYFFGQRQSNDFLLPILPAFLNDRDEQLRAAFYGQIVYVCCCVGQRSVEEYLLPYIEQALSDVMEAVIVNALECLSMLCRSGFLRKRILLDMIERVFPLLCYPIQWVRRAAVSFIAESSKSLGPVDSYVYLSPVLRLFLLREPASLSCEMSLFSCLKPPVSKLVFYQVLENARSSDMLERQRKIWYNSSPNSNQWETAAHGRRVPGDLNPTRSAKYAAGTTHMISSQDTEDAAKLRSASSFTSSNLADVKDSSFLSDKMQFSGFISPQVINGNSSLCDGPSEGIPLYSFPTDKHAGEAVSAGPDSLLHWNSTGVDSSCMRWLDPVTKSVESSQVVPLKLVSGSFYDISNSSKLIPRSSRDSETRENKFQDVSVFDTLKGPTSIVSDDSPHSKLTGSTSLARTPLILDTGWKPRGVLVAHLQEHRSALNGLVVSNDQHFFISTSDDSTVKIWDTRKLTKDISFRSRLTYHLGGSRALSATMLCGMAQVVVGDCDGTLHMFSVDYVSRGSGSSVVERYSGIADIKKKEVGEGAILSLLNCSASDSFISQTLLYSTLRCGVHLWDTRGNSAAWNFRTVPEEGYISSLVMGQCGNWFVSGSSRGVLTLWDLRFLLPVNSWKYSTVCPVERMCLFIPPANAISAMSRPLLYVAAGCNEVSLWNAENGSCHQVFRIASSETDADISNIPRALARPSRKTSSKQDAKRTNNSKDRMDELNEPAPRLPGIRSLLPLPGGDLLTGGTDMKIRYWDHKSPDRCYSVCGPSIKGIASDEYYDVRSSSGVQVVQELSRRAVAAKLNQKALLAVAASDTAGCHRDSVLSLASVKLNQRLMISGTRDGAIKVWK